MKTTIKSRIASASAGLRKYYNEYKQNVGPGKEQILFTNWIALVGAHSEDEAEIATLPEARSIWFEYVLGNASTDLRVSFEGYMQEVLDMEPETTRSEAFQAWADNLQDLNPAEDAEASYLPEATKMLEQLAQADW